MAILDFQKPDQVIITENTETHGVFELQPLEPGYGITLVMLSEEYFCPL